MAAFGYNYKSNDQNFNPWATYAGGSPAPGMNDGYYQAAQDKAIWQNNGQAENSVNRVWRWTLDDLRRQGMDPGSADRGTVQAAYLNNVARLRRDIEAPDNAARGLTWQNSGLQGYDRFLQQPNLTGGPPPVDPKGNPLPPPPPTDPNAGRPKTNTQNGGLGAGQPNNNAPNNPGLGGGQPLTNYGSAGLNAAQAGALADDPDQAYQFMLRQLGMDPNVPGYFSKFLKQKFAPLLQARLAAQALGNGGDPGGGNGQYLDNIGGNIGEFGKEAFATGGNFFQNQTSIANQALQNAQPYLSGLTDQDQVKGYLDQLNTLAYAGANPLIQQSLADTITRGYDQYKYDSFNKLVPGQQGDPYLEWLKNNAKYNRYLPVR
jgi:hypothetical protein